MGTADRGTADQDAAAPGTAAPGTAAQDAAAQGAAAPGTADQRTADIVVRIRELLIERYIFPDVAEAIAAVLAQGQYTMDDLPAFAESVTRDLQSINGDKHLRLLYSEPELSDALTDDARERADLAAWVARTAGGVARVARLPANIGYLELRPLLFPSTLAGPQAVAAMNLVADNDALILDLRGCRGGAPDMVSLLCSYLFGDEPVHLNDIYQRAGDETVQFWTQSYVPGRRYGPDKPVYVLTSARTFSGGEELSYNLRQAGRATLVGEPTGGGAHPREGFRVHPHLEATIPVARSVHPVTGTNWEGTGVIPHVEVPAAEAPAVAYRRALADVVAAGTVAAGEADDALAELDRAGILPW